MGILNVTPDSFSDGGSHFSKDDALAHAFAMIDAGADIIDVGGESTRPGSSPVSAEEEIRRVIPVIRGLSDSASVTISADTMKSAVAAKAIDAGADMINDMLGLRGEGMMEIVSSSDIAVIIAHMHGTPATLATDLMRGDAMPAVKRFLDERADAAIEAGVKRNNIILDPGLGFGKTPEQNEAMMRDPMYFGRDFPVLIGPSRKRFLAHMFPGEDRDIATAKACIIASEADILRVHNVEAVRKALEIIPRQVL